MQDNFNSNNGSIKGNIEVIDKDHLKNIWNLILKGDSIEVRKYFTEHISDVNGFFRPFEDYTFENCTEKTKLLSLGVIISEHQWRSAYDQVDQEVNANGMFCKIIKACCCKRMRT